MVDRGGIKRAAVAAVFLCTVAVTARRVGELDRTESTAIAAVRAIQSGQFAYASINAGYYDSLECLVSLLCVPGRSGVGPFLAPELAAGGEMRGYRFVFSAGPKPESADAGLRSPSSITRFAVAATPSGPKETDDRSFCGDDTGSIYVVAEGSQPRVDAGRCLDTSVRLP